MSVAQSQLLYAAPVCTSALVFEKNIQVRSGPPRKMAIRITWAYKMVSMKPSTLPLKLQAAEKCKTHDASFATVVEATTELCRLTGTSLLR